MGNPRSKKRRANDVRGLMAGVKAKNKPRTGYIRPDKLNNGPVPAALRGGLPGSKR